MASRTVRVRLDSESERGLALLMGEGRSESEAVRAALSESGRRRLRRPAVRADVERLVNDSEDTAERRRVMAEMNALSPRWPQ